MTMAAAMEKEGTLPEARTMRMRVLVEEPITEEEPVETGVS